MAEKKELASSTPEADVPDASWTITKLKGFLKQRGAILSGKKAELLER